MSEFIVFIGLFSVNVMLRVNVRPVYLVFLILSFLYYLLFLGMNQLACTASLVLIQSFFLSRSK